MSKLQLPEITLICCDGVNAERAKNVIELCKTKADFGAVKLLTHLPVESEHRVEIMPLKSLVAYSIWCLTEMHKHIDTPFGLVVQRDGWILNPQSWNPDWLNYDYIGPLFVQHDDVGSGGFSMRSKRIMQAAAKRIGDWDGTEEHAQFLQVNKARSYEDGVLAMTMRYDGEWNYAPPAEAAKFGQGGNKGKKYYEPYPFGFHGNRQEIDFQTGYVHPLCEHDGEDCGCRGNISNVLMQMES